MDLFAMAEMITELKCSYVKANMQLSLLIYRN